LLNSGLLLTNSSYELSQNAGMSLSTSSILLRSLYSKSKAAAKSREEGEMPILLGVIFFE